MKTKTKTEIQHLQIWVKRRYLQIFSFHSSEKNDENIDTTKITTDLKKLEKSKKRSLKMKRCCVLVRKTERKQEDRVEVEESRVCVSEKDLRRRERERKKVRRKKRRWQERGAEAEKKKVRDNFWILIYFLNVQNCL